MSKQEDFHRPEKPLEKSREIDNEARISKEAEMKRKFNRNQKRIEKQFGDPQFLIHKHMTTLLSLDTISSIFDLKNLRKVYDEAETQIRTLENLGLDPKSYGSLLVPVLMSKLPDVLKRLISRQFGKRSGNYRNNETFQK